MSGNESERYIEALTNDNAQAYEDFLREFPNGKHFIDAQQRLASLQHNSAEAEQLDAERYIEALSSGAHALREFLDVYPDSKYSEAGREKLSALENAAPESIGKAKTRNSQKENNSHTFPNEVIKGTETATEEGKLEEQSSPASKPKQRTSSWGLYIFSVLMLAVMGAGLYNMIDAGGVKEYRKEKMIAAERQYQLAGERLRLFLELEEARRRILAGKEYDIAHSQLRRLLGTGNPEAAALLAGLYFRGHGTDADFEEAKKLAIKGFSTKYPSSFFVAGLASVEKPETLAYLRMGFELMDNGDANQSDPWSSGDTLRARMEELREELSSSELLRASELVKSCKASSYKGC